jgi:hypothetical protein
VMCGFIGIFVIAVLLGAIVTELFLRGLRLWLRLQKHFWDPKPNDDPETRPVPPRLMGVLERLVFSLLVWWVGLTDATITGMFAWLALKMATNWTRPRDVSNPTRQAKVIRLSQVALLAGVISLMFAAWGGVVAQGNLWLCSHGNLSLHPTSTLVPNGELSANRNWYLSFRARQAYRGPRVQSRGPPASHVRQRLALSRRRTGHTERRQSPIRFALLHQLYNERTGALGVP